jgi:hypothetical protein
MMTNFKTMTLLQMTMQIRLIKSLETQRNKTMTTSWFPNFPHTRYWMFDWFLKLS